jgi:hypothetical protein
MNVITDGYSSRLAGWPHYDGTYTGEYTTDNGQEWYRLVTANGDEYDTTDKPIEVISMGIGPIYTEQQVTNDAGTIVFAVAHIPAYWITYLATGEADAPTAEEQAQEAAYYASIASQYAPVAEPACTEDDDDDQGYCGPTCGRFGNW